MRTFGKTMIQTALILLSEDAPIRLQWSIGEWLICWLMENENEEERREERQTMLIRVHISSSIPGGNETNDSNLRLCHSYLFTDDESNQMTRRSTWGTHFSLARRRERERERRWKWAGEMTWSFIENIGKDHRRNGKEKQHVDLQIFPLSFAARSDILSTDFFNRHRTLSILVTFWLVMQMNRISPLLCSCSARRSSSRCVHHIRLPSSENERSAHVTSESTRYFIWTTIDT